MINKRKVAEWVSKGGRYTVTLYADSIGYTYRGDGCGGTLLTRPGSIVSDDTAIIEMQTRIDRGGFQPDTNKTAMILIQNN